MAKATNIVELQQRRVISRQLLVAVAAVVVVVFGVVAYCNQVFLGQQSLVLSQDEGRRNSDCLLRVDPAELNAVVHDDVHEIRFGFKIVNNSAKPVHITKVVSSCSCSIGRLSADIIPPQGYVTLDVRYDVVSQFGELPVRTIRIVTDSVDCQDLFCRVGGTRLRRFEIVPATLDFGKMRTGEESSKSVRITGSDVDFAIDKIASLGPSVVIEDVNLQHGKNGVQTVQLNARFKAKVGAGVFETTLMLPQRLANAPAAVVPIRAMVSGPVIVEPQAAFLGFAEPGESPEAAVRIRSNLRGSLQLDIQTLEVVELSDALVCEVNTDDALVLIRLQRQKVQAGTYRGKIVIRCVIDGEEYRLSVPVHALLR